MLARAPWLVVVGCCACADPLFEPADAETSSGDPSSIPLRTGWPVSETCELGPSEPGGLLVTTTDFTTGALSVVDGASRTVTPDVAVGSPDAVPYADDARVAVVHRFRYDFIDFLDPNSWTSRGQHALEADDATAPNPHGIAFDDGGLAYVSLFGSRHMLVLDPLRAPGSSVVDTVDLGPFADADGKPEASLVVRCGDTLWVSIERLDVTAGFARVDHDALVAIDLPTRTPYDLQPAQDGGQGLSLRGAWLKQLRLDPADPSGRVLLGLTSGLERIDLRDGSVSWAVDEDAFADAGLGHPQLPLAFETDATGRYAYIAAYGPHAPGETDCAANPAPCFDQARLYEVDLHRDPPILQVFAEGVQAIDRTVQRLGQTLWVGSRQPDGPGLYTFDLRAHPPAPTGGPYATGLPPYSLTALPR